MDSKDDLNPSQSNTTENVKGSDESCFIVEESITLIEIQDETIVPGEESLKIPIEEVSEDLNGAENVELNNFEVIDEVGEFGSQATENTAEELEVNGADKITSEEICAPNTVDLNVTPIPVASDTRLLIDVKFHNRKTYLAFQEEFITLIKNYYKTKLDDLDVHDDMRNNRIRVSEKKVKKSDEFLIDKTPNLTPDEMSTPNYRKSFGRTLLTNDNEEENDNRRTSSTPKNSCFNCDKPNHSLRDCPEPRNMKKVNKARNEFQRSSLRYHDDNENEYGHLVPGVISDELRAALGLTKNQIPLHIYRMRLFGYPPGWIEEAKVHNSGLSLFLEKDKRQLQPGEDEGETDSNDFKYDLQKIHDFPGFNVAPDHPFVDLYRAYGTPPMMVQHSKEELIRSLGDDVVNGYKKTKLKDLGVVIDATGDKTSLTVADMDVEDASEDEALTVYAGPPLPCDSIEKPPEPMEDGELSNDSRCESPNEDELKKQRQALLAQIAESSVFLDTSSVNSSLNLTANPSQLETTIIENSENENRDNCAKDTTGQVNSTIFGCPVLPSFTPFNSLPAGEKFQEGVCDVINFENLAESTGKYEKMKVLIKKVRNFQEKHQQE